MRIRKTGPITPPNRGNIVNEYTTSNTDSYSSDYINTMIGDVEAILETLTTGGGVTENVNS